MAPRIPRTFAAITLLGLALGLSAAACGDDDDVAAAIAEPTATTGAESTSIPEPSSPVSTGPAVTVSLVVADVDRSIDFYRTIGLDIDEDSIFAQDGVSLHVKIPVRNGFDLDLDAIDVTRQWNPDWSPASSGARGILNFHVDDREAVDAMHAEVVAAGYAEQVEPFDAFWGARYAVVVDPDGNPVGIMSPAG